MVNPYDLTFFLLDPMDRGRIIHTYDRKIHIITRALGFVIFDACRNVKLVN